MSWKQTCTRVSAACRSLRRDDLLKARVEGSIIYMVGDKAQRRADAERRLVTDEQTGHDGRYARRAVRLTMSHVAFCFGAALVFMAGQRYIPQIGALIGRRVRAPMTVRQVGRPTPPTLSHWETVWFGRSK